MLQFASRAFRLTRATLNIFVLKLMRMFRPVTTVAQSSSKLLQAI